MTKNEQRQLYIAHQYAAAGMRDTAARTLATAHRCAMRTVTKRIMLEHVAQLDLTDRVTIVNGCLVHVDDAHMVGA